MKILILIISALYLSFLFFSCGYMQRQLSGLSQNSQSTQEQSLDQQIKSLKDRLSQLKASGADEDEIEDLEDEIEDLEDEVERLREQQSLNIDIDDYLDSVVYIYLLNGECNNQSSASEYSSCVLSCVRSSRTVASLNTCINSCNSSHNCKALAGRGSGVFLSDSQILTNHHVIKIIMRGYPENSKYYFNISTAVENHSKQRTFVRSVRWYDTTDDIALVQLNSPLSNAFAPEHGSLNDLKLLDTLFTIGNPAGVTFTASQGHLTNKNPSATGLCRNCITYSIPVGGGNSGGPVFNREGELVALIAGVKLDTNSGDPYENLAFGPHIDRIKRLIDLNRTNDVTELQSLTQDQLQLLQQEDLEDIAETVIGFVKEQD